MSTPAIASELTREAMMDFARSWVAAWNRRDAGSVLQHFVDDAVFISPVAAHYAGSVEIRGRSQLSKYWHAALKELSTLEFTLDHASWDPERRELNVVYLSDLNGIRRRSCEIMTFNAEGCQIRGEAMFGAAMP